MANHGDLQKLLTVEAAATVVPMLTNWGVRDVGPLVHSLGCTFLTAVGRDADFAAVCEVPAPRQGPLGHVEENVRSDSVWFDRANRQVVLIAEFERYRGNKKDLGPKVETLLLAQQRWGCLDATLLLAYWTIGPVNPPDHESLRAIARGGFSANGGMRVPGNPRAKLEFFQFIVNRKEGDGPLRLEQIRRRGGA